MLETLPRRWWDASYKEQVRAAMCDCDDSKLAALGNALLSHLLIESTSTASLQVLDFVCRDELLCKRLLALDAFRGALEEAAVNGAGDCCRKFHAETVPISNAEKYSSTLFNLG